MNWLALEKVERRALHIHTCILDDVWTVFLGLLYVGVFRGMFFRTHRRRGAFRGRSAGVVVLAANDIAHKGWPMFSRAGFADLPRGRC